MTDCKTAKCYGSTGVIHLDIQVANEGGKPDEVVYFVPDDDHRVSHQGEKYAVFLPVRSCEDKKTEYTKAVVVKFGKNTDSVRLPFCNAGVSKMNKALLEAAMKPSKVDIKVRLGPKVNSDGKKLTLIGITVPARQYTK